MDELDKELRLKHEELYLRHQEIYLKHEESHSKQEKLYSEQRKELMEFVNSFCLKQTETIESSMEKIIELSVGLTKPITEKLVEQEQEIKDLRAEIEKLRDHHLRSLKDIIWAVKDLHEVMGETLDKAKKEIIKGRWDKESMLEVIEKQKEQVSSYEDTILELKYRLNVVNEVGVYHDSEGYDLDEKDYKEYF